MTADPHFLLFVIPATSPPWLRDLADRMADEGYHVDTVSTVDELMTLRKTLSPDVVLLGDGDATAEGLDTMRSNGASELPLRVLITENTPDDLFNVAVDLVVLPVPAMLSCQLATCLRLRDQVRMLRDQNHTLDDEMRRLTLLLKEYQQTTDEVALLKNAIVRNVSHELKTPLLHVKSAVAMLAEDTDSNNLIQYATEAVARLESIVNNITRLAYSMEIHFEPVVVNEIVDHALRNLRRSWQHKDAVGRVRTDLARSLPPVRGDKQGLGTVLHLLIDNALKFSEDEVEVCARLADDAVELSVRDTGIGIPADQIERIFESFYQIDSKSTRRYGGTGAGLAIVKLILDRHKVTIKVESREDEGSTFSFRLPLADIQADL